VIRSEFIAELRDALSKNLPYGERAPDRTGTPASVLLLFGSSAQAPSEPLLLLTRRTDRVETHKGQMAFPGGMREKAEDELTAALRETEEEVGISRSSVEILGRLPGLWTVTGFWVTPFVGVLSESLEKISLQINEAEIAQTYWISLRELQSEKTYRKEWIEHGAVRFPIHCYYVGEKKEVRIWGATGSMIQNLLARLEGAPSSG
jgi:8-oxo-dGTP pyrophosphatase MutT (NUDIX family)